MILQKSLYKSMVRIYYKQERREISAKRCIKFLNRIGLEVSGDMRPYLKGLKLMITGNRSVIGVKVFNELVLAHSELIEHNNTTNKNLVEWLEKEVGVKLYQVEELLGDYNEND